MQTRFTGSTHTSVTGGKLYELTSREATGDSSRSIADETDILHRRAQEVRVQASELHTAALLRDLDSRRGQHARNAPRDILSRLSDLGLGWRDIARITGVSVPAVQKWRRGEGSTGANRLKLAKISALIEMLEDRLINDPASWLEMRIHEGVALTPLDLLVDGRFDLVLKLASQSPEDAHEVVLDDYDPNWRVQLVDETFESFVASDGTVSLRPKG